MSVDLYTVPGIIKREDDKESIVDIYVSAESLRVYEKPWEDTSPNIPGPAGHQHPVAVSENSGRRNHDRTDPVFVGVCLLLLAVILALICLGVQMKKDKSNWRRERDQLLAEIASLRKTSDDLTANNTELSGEIENVRRTLCRHKVSCWVGPNNSSKEVNR